MGRPKRLYPLGKYRLRIRGAIDSTKAYLVELEYTWNRQIVRKGMNIFVKVGDWNEKLNKGRGGVKNSYGPEANRINALLLGRVDKIDGLLAEYSQRNPNQITAQLINDFLSDKPLIRQDKGKDFIEFATERLDSDYSRNRIGRSRYMNGKSGLNIFQTFLRATKKGTYKTDSIYVGEVSVELIDEYISWRRDVKLNCDATINHSLAPILKACAYAAELRLIDPSINARLQDMRIAPKISLSIDESEFDGKSLSQEEFGKLVEFYSYDKETRRKEFIEMFLFAFHACGLRVVDVMTLQWGHIDFEKKELRKVMVKTNKRHVIPLSEPAIDILKEWKEKRPDAKYVFDLVKDELDIDNDESLYRARNSATKCINQSLNVVGEKLGLKFSLTMHVARHTFAVLALNNGLSMTVVSRLLGHASTDITEKVYAKFLPETLSVEMARINSELEKYRLF
ncbi:MAG: tyrosine-type recombinase/integrase [Bacteroides sp.]|nr:tyrosine-type recombinase/integrase [Bacteroides sp.]